MIKYIKSLIFQLICVFLILSVCFLYIRFTPESSSWLHEEEKLEGNYKIGKIDLWHNGIENITTPVTLSPFAPTRFFQTGADRDENFDMAVNPYQITGANKGDIDIKIDMSYNDSNSSNYSIFYIFVPADTQDANFLGGHYRDYLDSVFSGYTLTTNAQRKAAMDDINTNTLDLHKGTVLLKEQTGVIFYLLTWSEYDNIPAVTGTGYVSIHYPITIMAHSYQFYH